MNEYEQRLIDAVKELSIVSSNSAIPWVQRAASKGYNEIIEYVGNDIEDHPKFFREVYK
jgi:hypothetical protein